MIFTGAGMTYFLFINLDILDWLFSCSVWWLVHAQQIKWIAPFLFVNNTGNDEILFVGISYKAHITVWMSYS